MNDLLPTLGIPTIKSIDILDQIWVKIIRRCKAPSDLTIYPLFHYKFSQDTTRKLNSKSLKCVGKKRWES